MRVVNIMLGKKLGGIEQAFLDYTQALLCQNNEVYTITHPSAKINSTLSTRFGNEAKINHIFNIGKWDIIATLRLAILLNKIKPDIIICHGNRAISLAKRAYKKCPIVGVSHNYSLKYLIKCDAILALTTDLYYEMRRANYPANNLYKFSNMIDTNGVELNVRPVHEVFTIGVMGRLVHKKGIDQLIKAVSYLKDENIKVKLLIAGEGSYKGILEYNVSQYKINDQVEFVGWVDDKKKFFDQIDALCVPSYHEPFGIVILEAFLHSTAVISTNTEGPREIIKHMESGILLSVAENSAYEFRSRIKYLIGMPSRREHIAEGGYKTVCEKYDLTKVSSILQSHLEKIINSYQKNA